MSPSLMQKSKWRLAPLATISAPRAGKRSLHFVPDWLLLMTFVNCPMNCKMLWYWLLSKWFKYKSKEILKQGTNVKSLKIVVCFANTMVSFANWRQESDGFCLFLTRIHEKKIPKNRNTIYYLSVALMNSCLVHPKAAARFALITHKFRSTHWSGLSYVESNHSPIIGSLW